jgi:hypothetical protein
MHSGRFTTRLLRESGVEILAKGLITVHTEYGQTIIDELEVENLAIRKPNGNSISMEQLSDITMERLEDELADGINLTNEVDWDV